MHCYQAEKEDISNTLRDSISWNLINTYDVYY